MFATDAVIYYGISIGARWILWVLDRRGGTNRAIRTLVSAEVEAGVALANALRAGRGRRQSAHRLLRALARQRGGQITTSGAVSLS